GGRGGKNRGHGGRYRDAGTRGRGGGDPANGERAGGWDGAARHRHERLSGRGAGRPGGDLGQRQPGRGHGKRQRVGGRRSGGDGGDGGDEGGEGRHGGGCGDGRAA